MYWISRHYCTNAEKLCNFANNCRNFAFFKKLSKVTELSKNSIKISKCWEITWIFYKDSKCNLTSDILFEFSKRNLTIFSKNCFKFLVIYLVFKKFFEFPWKIHKVIKKFQEFFVKLPKHTYFLGLWKNKKMYLQRKCISNFYQGSIN